MKPSPKERSDLVERIVKRRGETPLTDADLGRRARVHPSQVGRICRGDFKTFSSNVVQVCKALGLAIELPDTGTQDDDGRLALEQSVTRAWDRSIDGAKRLARVIDAVSDAMHADAGPGHTA